MSKNNKLQLGKQWGLRRMANAQGHFTMVALDQRPPIINLIAAKRGVAAADVAFADVLSIKHLLVDVLGPYSSAMLLDPNYAFPAALASLPARTGLVVTLEEHKFEETPDGRRSANIDNWSVAKIKRAGGDGVKVLAWYRPDASTEICEYQKAYVKSIGDACREQDIPFVFELLVYPFPSNKNHTTDYVESPEKLPSLVLDSVREFAKPEYGVDLLKLESPLAGASLPARDGSAVHLEAQAQFDKDEYWLPFDSQPTGIFTFQ
jgi:tagatose 1,6-diphosphate aldolase